MANRMARATCAILLLLVLAAPGAGAVDASLLGRPLRAVRFESNAPIYRDDLRRAMVLPLGEPLTQERLDQARRILELKKIFLKIDFRLEPGGDGVVLMVQVVRKRKIDTVDVKGYDHLRAKEMDRLIRLRKGMIFDPDLIDPARQRVLDRYHEMGFPDARIDARVDRHDGEVDLKFQVREGPPLIIDAVAIEDESGQWTEVLRKEVEGLDGKRFTRDAQRKAEKKLTRKLRKEKYYEVRVSSDWRQTGDHGGTLTFTVEPGPPFDVRVEGNRHKDEGDLLGLMDLRDRLIITDGTWRELARRMQRAYEDDGYYRAKVDVSIREGPPKRVVFRVDEGRRYVLTDLEFEGNEHFSHDRLQDQMATAPARCFPWPRSGVLIDDVLDEDLKRLWFYYRQHGFESAQVVDARRELDEKTGTIKLTIVIDEGPRTYVRQIERPDLPALRDVEPQLKVEIGQPLSPEVLDADKKTIVDKLDRAGYADAKADYTIETENRDGTIDAIVKWDIDPGERQRAGRIIVQGNIDTQDRAILREVPFKEGDPLYVEEMLRGQVDIYRLGIFRGVSVRPITPEGKTVRDVGVDVSEKPPGTLEFGGGYNTRDGLGVFLEMGYGNVGGMARRLTLRGQFSLDPTSFLPDQYFGSLGYTEPRLYGLPWRFKSNLLGERSTQTVNQYSIERVSFVNGVDRDVFNKRVNLGAEAQVEQARVFDVKPDAVLTSEDTGSLRTIALSPFVVYDGRDDPFAPTKGLLDSARLRYGLPTLSTVHFGKVITQHTQFFSIAKDVVFLYSLRAGIGHAFSGSDLLPIRERFFLGGRTTVRGFKENDVGPKGSTGDPVGGDLALNLNLELRFPLLYGFGGAVFVDGGGVYLLQCGGACRQRNEVNGGSFAFDNFRRSAGLGLRYQTPVGPISLDYGFKLDRRHNESIGRVHFSIGATF
jgi:outer membrane protein insertion porin family